MSESKESKEDPKTGDKAKEHLALNYESESDSSVESVNSNNSNVSFEFTAENCQKRIDEFVEITETDSALAQFFLQDRRWNVPRAINAYFKRLRKEDEKKSKNVVYAQVDSSNEEADDEEDDTKEGSSKKKLKANLPQSGTTSSDPGEGTSAGPSPSSSSSGDDNKRTQVFRHITWNIDGLNDKNRSIRVAAVADHIIQSKADLIFLQEVTPECEVILKQKLQHEFRFFSGKADPLASYYVMTLVGIRNYLNVTENQILHFRQSLMGRNVLKTNVTVDGDVKLCLLNTHLESTKEGAALRVHQLSFLFNYFKEVGDDVSILAGGDLNLRDKELAGIGGLPFNTVDAWIEGGKRKECEFTWDMTRNDNLPYDGGMTTRGKRQFKPRMRFDRMYLRKTFPVSVQLVHFGLIGLQRLKPHVCFPSDHWGIITSYQIFHGKKNPLIIKPNNK